MGMLAAVGGFCSEISLCERKARHEFNSFLSSMDEMDEVVALVTVVYRSFPWAVNFMPKVIGSAGVDP
jgi:hypothetical protein